MALFSGNVFHMTRYPGQHHCKTKPLLCIDNVNESSDAVIFKIHNTWANSAELDLKSLAVPESTTPLSLHSPCSIHGSAHHQSGIILELSAVNSCKQYKNKIGFFPSSSQCTSQDSQGAVHCRCVWSLSDNPPAQHLQVHVSSPRQERLAKPVVSFSPQNPIAHTENALVSVFSKANLGC